MSWEKPMLQTRPGDVGITEMGGVDHPMTLGHATRLDAQLPGC
jgi:hypothetical protein